VGEVARSIQEQNEPDWVLELVKLAVVKSLEKHDRERDLVSCLLSSLYATVVPANLMAAGFNLILDRMEDLELDTPGAGEIVGTYLARAVVDDILPPSFLTKSEPVTNTGAKAVARAQRLLDGKNVGQKLSKVWGVPNKTYSKFKKSMRMLLQEYMDTGDLVEADRCLRELNVPTFHFQFVKLAVSLALENTEESQRKRISNLLSAFATSDLIVPDHMVSGFQCCVDCIVDLTKDVTPNAATLLLSFIDLAINNGYLPPALKLKAEGEIQKNLEKEQKKASDPKWSPSKTQERDAQQNGK